MTNPKRLPSHLDAERTILGIALLDPEAMPRVAHLLNPTDFYSPKHAAIWKAMLGLHLKSEPLDVLTVSAAVDDKTIEPSFVSSLLEGSYISVRSSSIESYVTLVRNARKTRDLIAVSAEIATRAYEESDFAALEVAAKTLILDAIGTEEGANDDVRITPERQAEIIGEMFVRLRQGESAAISTGFPTLDSTLAGGLHREQLIIVAARTSVGKSALAENIAETVAKGKGRILYVQLEMSKEQMLERYLLRAGLSRTTVKYGPQADSEEHRIEELMRERERWQVHIYNKPGATAMGIHSEVSRLILQEGPLDLVVVDYLQLMGDVQEDKMVTSIAKVTKTMKLIAREFHVPVILISQLNRNVEHRGGKPRLHDLAHSSAIENDADVVLLMWDTPETPSTSGNITHMFVAKNRQGPKEIEIPIVYVGPSFTFRDTGLDGSHQPSNGTTPQAPEAREDTKDKGRLISVAEREGLRTQVPEEVQ